MQNLVNLRRRFTDRAALSATKQKQAHRTGSSKADGHTLCEYYQGIGR
jgi:hypothetical protein